MSTGNGTSASMAPLTASLWIPYIVAQVVTNGFLAAQNYVDPTPRPVPHWGKRADRTYMNAVETFAPFAALVVLIQLDRQGRLDDGVLGDELLLAAGGARRRLSGRPSRYIRTLVFVLGYVCIIGLFVELMK